MTKRLISFLIALCLLIAIPLSARYKYNPFTRKLDYYEPVSGSDLGDLGDVTLTGLATGNVLYYNGTAWVNLVTGANTNVLTLAGGVPTWAATGVPAAHAASHEVGGADLVDHDQLTNWVANKHINWTAATDELDITRATAPLIDLNPAYVGTGATIDITPSAQITTVGADWDGIDIQGAALDPSVGSVEIHGININFAGISTAQDPYIDALNLSLPTDITEERIHAIHANRGFYLGVDIGDSVAGLTNTSVDVVYDTTGATGGMVHGLDVARAGGGTVSVTAVGTHSGVDVIHQHIGAVASFDKVWEYDNDAPGWTDITAECGNPALDVAIWDDADDEIYVGQATTFDEIPCVWNTPAAMNMFLDFYYSAGGAAWTAFIPNDDTLGATITGNIRFLASDLAGWAVDTVNGTANKYWIRIERTRVPFAGPTEDTIRYIAGVSYEWDADGLITIKDLVIVDIFGYDYTTDHNLLLGYLAGEDLTAGQGQYNTLLGEQAGTDVTTGDNNTIVGYQAGFSITDAPSNVAVGYRALYTLNPDSNTKENVAVGMEALYSLGYAGQQNVAVGAGAMRDQTFNANKMTAVGYQAGYQGAASARNVYVGYHAGYGTAISQSQYNVAVGNRAMFLISSATRGVGVGYLAGYNLTTGSKNTIVGADADYFNQTGENNTIVGQEAALGIALNSHSNNTIVGFQAAQDITTGSSNIIIGYMAGEGWLDAENEKLVIDVTDTATPLIYGDFSADNITINGDFNVTMDAALDQIVFAQSAVAGTENQSLIKIDDDRTGATVDEAVEAAIYMDVDGLYALYLADGMFGVADWIKYDETYFSVIYGHLAGNSLVAGAENNVLLGCMAGFDMTTGDSNVFLGHEAGYENVIGAYNIAIGQEAMKGQAGQSPLSNVAIGYSSLLLITTGQFNVAVGQQTGLALTDGANNTLIGYSAGQIVSTGDRNVVIGNLAGSTWLDTEDDLLVIDNSNTATPLIYGDFSTDAITINGSLSVTGDFQGKKADYIISLDVNYDDANPTTLYTVADGYVVTDCYIEVTTGWDGNGYIEIGDGNDDDGFMNNGNYDDSTPGYYGFDITDRGDYLLNGLQYVYTGADTIDVRVVTGTSTQGIATVYVHITRLK